MKKKIESLIKLIIGFFAIYPVMQMIAIFYEAFDYGRDWAWFWLPCYLAVFYIIVKYIMDVSEELFAPMLIVFFTFMREKRKNEQDLNDSLLDDSRLSDQINPVSEIDISSEQSLSQSRHHPR